MNLIRKIGLLRSLFIYYLKPFQIRRMKRFYNPFIRPGDLCFDIGAHVGNRTAVWRKLGAEVVSVEPQSDLFNYLQWHFGRDEGVHLVQRAVGANEGRSKLQISPSNPTVHTLANKEWREHLNNARGAKGDWNQTEEIQLSTLDRLIDTYGLPDFCKIDVEGLEPAVLAGLSQPIPKLSFECLQTADHLAVQCILRLEELDQYRYNFILGERMEWTFQEWKNAEEMISYIHSEFPDKRSGDIHAFL